MTHAAKGFQFRIRSFFRFAVYFSIVVVPLLFFCSYAKADPDPIDVLKNKIDDVIAKDSSRWAIDKYSRGDLTVTDVKETSSGHFEARGVFYHKTLFNKGSSKDFWCNIKMLLGSAVVERCCWQEANGQWCTQ